MIGKKIIPVIIGLLFTLGATAQESSLKWLKISSKGRYFQTSDGKPFFWLGDTGWLLFSKCNREEAIQYLDLRRQQGFNVIQVMLIHDLKNAINKYGDTALVNADLSRPNIKEGTDFNNPAAYDFWDHVDFIIDEAAVRGIYMALVPVWGSNVKDGKVSLGHATSYASFLVERFKHKPNIIWLNGGDIKGSDGMNVWKTMGVVIKKNDPQHLMTFHPRGRYSSSEWFHSESWLDFNMFQSGHRNYAQDTSQNEKNHFGEDNWRYVQADYRLKPVKPTLDGEPSYENIPHGLHDSLQPRWTAADLRRYAYWSVFAGGAGFTYGENAVMQFHSRGDKDANFGVNNNWKQTMTAPGAEQMQWLSRLVLSSKSYFDRVPAQEILVANSGQKYEYLLATKGKRFAMVYTHLGNSFQVAIPKLRFKPISATWYDPRTGERTGIVFSNKKKIISFDPPGEPAPGNDWVLILE
ncbi:MAG TPA: glycoside hydrolase family 140 protein [Chitinophagaceae bacterium]|nr:glycoside hydrolase family 140 protein [Chitinophagaceae bacterium]